MSEANIVTHHGIHFDPEGVAFLEQGRGSTNAVGLHRKSPFVVKLESSKRHCNHMIPLSTPVPNDHHWEFFMSLLDDPLVRAMLPIPKADGGVYFVANQPNLTMLLVLLSKMSSPIYNVVIPMWTLTGPAILTELQNTNVQPFVITDCEPKHSDLISKISQAAVYLPRKVVFAGDANVALNPGCKRITTTLTDPKHNLNDLAALPWEQLGATVVRKFMRREWHPRG
jgi:hypothetical protein